VDWGTPMPRFGSGVYVVALTEPLDECPLSDPALEELLAVRPELTVDGRWASTRELAERLAAFWLFDEVVLYIGLAGTSLRTRVGQYYRTRLGARSPHAGGWFLKTLSVLPKLQVHYASTADPRTRENAMLAAFSTSVSAEARATLHDPDRPIPFANLEWPKGRFKKHGIKGAKEKRA